MILIAEGKGNIVFVTIRIMSAPCAAPGFTGFPKTARSAGHGSWRKKPTTRNMRKRKKTRKTMRKTIDHAYGVPKIAHEEKIPFGGEVFKDKNNNIIGYGLRDSGGKEVFLDSNFQYAGEKQKDLFRVNACDWKEKGSPRKGSAGNTIYMDRDYSYLTRGCNTEKKDYIWRNGQRSESQDSGNGKGRTAKGVFLAVSLIVTVFVALWLILK